MGDTKIEQAIKNNSSLITHHASFLLEIGTEEIPARFIQLGVSLLKERVLEFLKDASIEHGDVIEYCTPRRLAIYIKDVSETQRDKITETIGPPKKVAFDDMGNPTQSAIGFARSMGVEIKDLTVIKTTKGEYVAVITKEKGRMTRDILCESLPEIISSIQFPKMMRWGNGNLRFVRPIHWVLALFDTEPIRFNIDNIMSGDITYGHHFISPQAIRIDHPSNYTAILRNNYVIASFDERRYSILHQMERLEVENDIHIYRDEELLNTVTNLVEYPNVVLGQFDREYLTLPNELLITVMKSHQKYFPSDDKDGNLLPIFAIVSNTKAENNEIVKRGAERVLKARLEDAKFYYNEDRKKPLWDYVEGLKRVTFHEEIGSLFEKAERIASISSFIADKIGLKEKEKENLLRTAMLSKADLITGVVREFPELQGYIGMIYAKESGEDEEVAKAIYEHYLPRFSGDKLPSTEIGLILSIADKMDNITSSFFLGLIPSGSEDPFALRRQAIGIINILQEKDLPLSLNLIIENALRNLEDYTPSIKKLTDDIIRFFLQRLEGVLLSQGFSHDIIDAVLARDVLNIKDIKERLHKIAELKFRPNFPELLTSAKRVYNILSKAHPPNIKRDLFIEPAEQKLYSVTLKVMNDIKKANRYESLFELETPINHFFDNVLVMDKNKEIRDNRLALLKLVKDTFELLCNFSRIAG